MKSLLFTIVLVVISSLSIAQESQSELGVWSFKELDRSAMEHIDEDKIKMVTNMFQGMKMEFKKGGTCHMEVMGQAQEVTYTRSGDTLLLDKGDRFIFLKNNTARMEAGNSRLLFVQGDLEIEKTYTYLTQSTYLNKSFKNKLLLGEWEVKEVRAPKDVEGGAMYEMMGMMITFNFITKNQIALGVSGMETVEEYKIDKETQELVFIKEDGDSIVYVLKEVAQDYFIAQHVKQGSLLYFMKK